MRVSDLFFISDGENIKPFKAFADATIKLQIKTRLFSVTLSIITLNEVWSLICKF